MTKTAYHPTMRVDPYGNHNNHDAILIDRAVYRANAALYALENKTIARIRAITREATQ